MIGLVYVFPIIQFALFTNEMDIRLDERNSIMLTDDMQLTKEL